MTTELSNGRRRTEYAVLGLIALAALVLRIYYVHSAVALKPFLGDAIQYRAYAWNLIHHQTFSGTASSATAVTPDSFRDPGYPMFLAALGGDGRMGAAFVERIFYAQSLLSALTVWLFSVMAYRWAGFWTAIATGSLLALWPHTITLSGNMLSETLLGAVIACALFMTDEALRRRHAWRPVTAGLFFALAGLTNGVVAPFAPLVACFMAWRDPANRRFWLLFLIGTMIPLGAWSTRSVLLPHSNESSLSRAKMNFVQGAWPEYHPAFVPNAWGDPQARAIMKSIDDEYHLLNSDTSAGMSEMVHRLADEPIRYIRWYLSKPSELWGWDIGIGSGDIYVFQTYNSPLLLNPILRGIVGVLFFLSPFIFLLAAIGVVISLCTRSRSWAALNIAGALGLWVTLIYAVLQSDARYSTPFRGIELFFAAYAVKMAVDRLQMRRESLSGKLTPRVIK